MIRPDSEIVAELSLLESFGPRICRPVPFSLVFLTRFFVEVGKAALYERFPTTEASRTHRTGER